MELADKLEIQTKDLEKTEDEIERLKDLLKPRPKKSKPYKKLHKIKPSVLIKKIEEIFVSRGHPVKKCLFRYDGNEIEISIKLAISTDFTIESSELEKLGWYIRGHNSKYIWINNLSRLISMVKK